MASFDSRFTKYLATGDYESAQDSAPMPTVAPDKKPAALSPESVVAQDAVEKYLALDAAPFDLAAHDRRFHPNGFDPKKDHCGLRESMAKIDKADDLGNAGAHTPIGVGKSGKAAASAMSQEATQTEKEAGANDNGGKIEKLEQENPDNKPHGNTIVPKYKIDKGIEVAGEGNKESGTPPPSDSTPISPKIQKAIERDLADREKQAERDFQRWMKEDRVGSKNRVIKENILKAVGGDREKAMKLYGEFEDLRSLGMMTTSMDDIDKFGHKLGDTPEAKAVVQQLKDEKQRSIDELDAYYNSVRNTRD